MKRDPNETTGPRGTTDPDARNELNQSTNNAR